MKLKNLKFGTILLVLGALVNLPRWTGLFVFSDHAPAWIGDVIPVLDTIGGLFAGLAIAGALAFAAHRLGSLQPFTPKGKPVMRFWGTLVSTISILVLSAFLLPPYIRMTTPAQLRVEIADLRSWSVMAVLVGDLIIVAVALADARSAGFTRSKVERPQKNRSARGKSRSAKTKIVECRYAGAGCERTGSQPAMNAHARSCKFKPTISMPAEEKTKVEQ